MLKTRIIFFRSVDLIAQSGGEGLSQFHCLVEGERKSFFLISEMKNLFYYAQILHQSKNMIAARIISDTVAIEQIPNLMRAIGYFPTNKEVMFTRLLTFFLKIYLYIHINTRTLLILERIINF